MPLYLASTKNVVFLEINVKF
uniref:Uncharacterized protein n=1 Tax=Anguilla anguilla TaxID=7936 RepID=A0A0E9SAL4_ANGAN